MKQQVIYEPKISVDLHCGGDIDWELDPMAYRDDIARNLAGNRRGDDNTAITLALEPRLEPPPADVGLRM